MLTLRPFRDPDWAGVWPVLQATFAAGETYSFPPDIGEAEARKTWIDGPMATFVAEEDGRILGTYFIKPNQPGLGAHVCNCGYVVAAGAEGRGIAAQMCEHSQRWAVEHGFLAMQFNFVVSTNERAVRLWQAHGKQEEAYQLLAEIYGWFTEGFETVDLREAKALLEAFII